MVAKKIFLSVDGVRYHIRNIYSKLDAKNRADAISKAYAKNIFRRNEYVFQVFLTFLVHIKRNGLEELWIAVHSFRQTIEHEQVKDKVDIAFGVLPSQFAKGTPFDTHRKRLD